MNLLSLTVINHLSSAVSSLSNDVATRRDRPPNKPSIPDPRIDQTDDQALGRPMTIYIRPHPNKPSIPDPRINQADDQALGRPRSLYIRLHPNKSLIPDL